MKKRFKNKKGFTLVELIIVIAILAILAAIAIPNFVGLTDEAKKAKEVGNASAIAASINTWNQIYAADTSKLISDKSTAKSTLTTIWPQGMAAADETAALARITITNYVATVNTTAAAAAPAPAA